MPDYQDKLKELFYNRGESVINLPDWLLSPSKIEKLSDLPGLAVVEVAGRDSVAAAFRAVELYNFTDLIPVYAFTGTESGPWSSVETAAETLASTLPNVRVHDLVVMGSSEFWRALNGRFVDELINRYGFYTPCIGCHMYLHSLRIPLAVTLGNVPIVSGERELHNRTIKINQTAPVLAAYSKLAESFGIKLFFPLQHIKDGKEIDEILGFDWQEGKDQPGCVLSGNYRKFNGGIRIKESQVKKYLQEFLSPLTKKIIESYISGIVPGHVKIASEIIGV
ncbi:hypothetical protein ACFL2O_00750 [Thermodesulfobacteriota bacterium]